jgi:Putative porin
MKKLAALTLSMFLVSGTALADTTKDAAPQPAKAAQPAKPKAAKWDSAIAAEIEELRQALQSQQEQLQLLKEELAKRDRQIDEAREAAAAANARAVEASSKATETVNTTAEVKATTTALAAAQPQDADVAARVTKAEKDLASEKKETEGKIKSIGPFSFSGDMRVRDEPFFGGPVNQSQVRNRERFRLRFNVNAKFSDDISGGFSLASGDLNDPISTNQTDIQFYTRKPIAIDRAFVNYTPHQFKPLLLTGGKFAYPFYRTELVWDNDLNPEGVAQTLQWNFGDNTPVIKRFAVVGFELPFTEVQHTVGTNRSRVESEVYGGQVQALWQLASWLKLSTYGAFYNYHNPDPIAFATATSNGNPQTPLVGLLPLAGASVQNSVTTTTVKTIVTADVGGVPTALPTGVTAITNAQFASKFGLFDGIARFDIKTSSARLPLVVLGDYVQNTKACANVGNLPATGTTTTATAITTVASNAACVSRERRGYWLEGRVGRLSEVHDWQFSYTRMFIEREAVMGAFNFSDLRQNSNVSQHRLEVFYQAYKNIQLGFTGLFGRPLNWHTAAAPEPILKRLQFDVVYKF